MLKYWSKVLGRARRDTFKKLDFHSPSGWFRVLWPIAILGIGYVTGQQTGSAIWGAASSALLLLLTFAWAALGVPPTMNAEQDAQIEQLKREKEDLVTVREQEALELLSQHVSSARRDVRIVVPDPIFLIHLVPVLAQADRYLIDPQAGTKALPDLTQISGQEWWQAGKPKPVQEFRNPEAQTYTRVFRTGVYQYYRTIDEELLVGANIDGRALETTMQRCVLEGLARYAALGVEGRIIAVMTLMGFAEKSLEYEGHVRKAQFDHLWLGHTFVQPPAIDVEAFRPMFDTMWRSFGWAYSPVARS
jgi:hypothetical protein